MDLGPIITLIKGFNDAWDRGDPELFREIAESTFSPDAIVVRPETSPLRVRELLPVWLSEVQAWQPQKHVIVNTIEGDGGAVYEWDWTATHSGPLLRTNGDVITPTHQTVHTRAAAIVRWDGERITSLEGLFSTYPDAVREISRAAPPPDA